MGITGIEIGPFTEGVNLVDPQSRLSPTELMNCLNLRIGMKGEVYKRPGHDFYGSTPAKINGDDRVNLLVRFYRAVGAVSTKLLIAAASGKLKYGNDGLGTWTDISIDGTGASMNVTNLCDWMVYKNRLYITDGTRVQRYPDPTSTDKSIYAGHFGHAAPTLAAVAVGGALSAGTYQYGLTSVAGDLGEGQLGSQSSVVTVLNGSVNLTAMAAAPARYGEVSKNIYRTRVNQTSPFFLVGNIPTGTTIFTDTLADAALSTQYVPVHRPPDDARFVIMGDDERAYWFGRGGANASLVDVSDIGFPDRIRDAGAGAFFSVSNNDNDILTGGSKIPGGLIFFKRNSMYGKKYGDNEGIFGIQPREKRGGGIGTISPFSVVYTPIGLIFLSQRGEIHKYAGTDTQIIGGVDTEDIGRKVAIEFKRISETSLTNVAACYHDYRYIISYDANGDKAYNWRTLEFDTRTGIWSGPFENGILYTPSYYSVWDSVIDDGELYWGESKVDNGSYVYGRKLTSKLDRGNRFVSRLRTGRLKLAKLGEVKTTKFFVEGEISADSQITATHINEIGTRVSVPLNIPVAAGTTNWDDGHDWGPAGNMGRWGDIFSQTLEGSLAAARSRTPIYEITDNGTAVDMNINNISLLVEALELK